MIPLPPVGGYTPPPMSNPGFGRPIGMGAPQQAGLGSGGGNNWQFGSPYGGASGANGNSVYQMPQYGQQTAQFGQMAPAGSSGTYDNSGSTRGVGPTFNPTIGQARPPVGPTGNGGQFGSPYGGSGRPGFMQRPIDPQIPGAIQGGGLGTPPTGPSFARPLGAGGLGAQPAGPAFGFPWRGGGNRVDPQIPAGLQRGGG